MRSITKTTYIDFLNFSAKVNTLLHFLNQYKAPLFQPTKKVVLKICSWFAGIKKTLDTKSEIYGEWLIKSISWLLFVLIEVWELALSWWRIISFIGCFSILFQNFCQTNNGCVSLGSIVLRFSKRTAMTCSVFWKKQAWQCDARAY